MKDDSSMTRILEAIGKKLIQLRIQKGYKSHVTFAEDFDLPRVQYWRMEKGKANFTLKSLSRVLAIHGLSLEKLFVEIALGEKEKGRVESNGKELGVGR